MAKNFVYSDINSSMKLSTNGNIEIEYDADAVIQSIKNIFATIPNERVRNPIGSSLLSYLFEPMSNDTADDIRREIISNIREYEPRVDSLKVNVRSDRDNNIYRVTVNFTIDEFSSPMRYQLNLRAMNNE